MLQRLCCLTSALQVHGHHPSPEASYVSEGHHRSHHLYLDPGRGSGAPSLLLLHHPSYAPQDPLLCGLAPHVRRPVRVRVFNFCFNIQHSHGIVACCMEPVCLTHHSFLCLTQVSHHSHGTGLCVAFTGHGHHLRHCGLYPVGWRDPWRLS